MISILINLLFAGHTRFMVSHHSPHRLLLRRRQLPEHPGADGGGFRLRRGPQDHRISSRVASTAEIEETRDQDNKRYVSKFQFDFQQAGSNPSSFRRSAFSIAFRERRSLRKTAFLQALPS